MNILNLTKKEIKANENGCIMCEYAAVNSVSFLAKLPKSAVVDHIKVGGVFLEDIKAVKIIDKHMETTEGKYKVVTTVYFFDDIPEIFEKLANHEITDFEVFYHLEAVIEE